MLITNLLYFGCGFCTMPSASASVAAVRCEVDQGDGLAGVGVSVCRVALTDLGGLMAALLSSR